MPINNLNKALEEFKKNPSQTLSAILKEVQKEYKYADLKDIGLEVAKILMDGHYHGSDLFDEMNDQQIAEYLSLDLYETSSEDGDTSESFDRWDWIQEFRNKFSDIFFEKMNESLAPFLLSESFKNFHAKAITIPGLESLTAEDLALALRDDPTFVSELHGFLTTMNG